MLELGKVVSINISKEKGVAKQPVKEAVFIENHGIQGDAHAGDWHRQVSLLAIESIRRMEKENIRGLCAGKFAENITTEGLVLHKLAVGTKFKIGDTVQELTQIGKKCHDGCAIKEQVGKCIVPKEGIFTKVLVGGIVKVGDIIEIYEK
ncbi:MOSC domain-containing protein [bacterium]|nr:MOSC domain-containing protein [bacterium]